MLVYFALLALWPIVGSAYGNLFRAAGNCLAGADYPRLVEFSSPRDLQENRDTRLKVVDRMGRMMKIDLSSRGHGFMPTSFVMALIVAAPIRWKRRLVAVLWGLFWVNVYIVLKLALFPIVYAGETSSESGRLSVALHAALRQGFWVTGNASVGWMIIPLIIWALTVLRSAEFGPSGACKVDTPRRFVIRPTRDLRL